VVTGEIVDEHDEFEWDVTDSLWGIYMDDDEYGATAEKMALAVAKENFDDVFTKKEV